jgi:hypothetical protein
MGLDTKTYWLTDRQSQCDFDYELVKLGSSREFIAEVGGYQLEVSPAQELATEGSTSWSQR